MIFNVKKKGLVLAMSLSLAAMSSIAAQSSLTDFNEVSNYAKKSIADLELSGVIATGSTFNPTAGADKVFAKQILGTLDNIGNGYLSYGEAVYLADKYRASSGFNDVVSVEGLLTKKGYKVNDIISREDFAYLVAHAKQEDITVNGIAIHNPAIAKPGPLLGPTVYQSGTNDDGAIYDGSTISLFHRAKQAHNSTFVDDSVYTLQVHPEVFKSVSVGGINVEDLKDMTAQLEVELADGTIHRTTLNSLIQFSIHGADGKVGQIRVEDGVLALVDDLKGYVPTFKLNGHEFNSVDVANRVLTQSYYNGDQTDAQVVNAVVNDLTERGFSLQDRRTMLHNLILTKTAIQQSGLSPLSAPFNTIAGPSSRYRGFQTGYLYGMYELANELRTQMNDASALRAMLSSQAVQQQLLDSTKILTAATLLPHITSISDAPFLPNEALTSRVKKAGALLPSEPIVFQYDRLKRAAYIILDDALSQGNASHQVTTGSIAQIQSADKTSFELVAKNFDSVNLSVKNSVLTDAIYDYLDAYEQIVKMISGVDFDGSLLNQTSEQLSAIDEAFSQPILDADMANIKIGDLQFKMDILATPSHVGNTFKPANAKTAIRASEAFGLEQAMQAFPTRMAQYICAGDVVTPAGEFIAHSKLDPLEQIDLINDFTAFNNESCESAISAPRYHQLLFVDNFQLPPFGPQAKFITAQGIEIINRVLLTPVDKDLEIEDIRLSYRINTPVQNSAPIAKAQTPESARGFRFGFLVADKSTDAENDLLEYKWQVQSGHALIFQTKYIPYALFLPLSYDPLQVSLQVNDGIANSQIVQKTINIR